ncbi:MAG TPA: glycosyltransferase family 61 protein [Candidatus Obscuribacterales bacterium]
MQISEFNQACRAGSEAALDAELLENRSWLRAEAGVLPLRLPLDHAFVRDAFFFVKPRSQMSLKYPLPESRLHVLPQARLISPAWAIVSHDNLLLQDSYFNDEILQRSGHFLKQRLKLQLEGRPQEIPFALYRPGLEQRQVDEPCYLPAYYWHFNYHHWLLECLPWLEDFVTDPRFSACKLVLPARLNAFQQASLELYGIEEDRILGFGEQECRFRRLYVPSLGKWTPERLRQLKQSLLQRAGIKPGRPEKRLYISRRDAATRRIVNEAALEALLRERGFEILDLAQMPLTRQMELMSQARVILGPHGAGLTNAIFAPSECLLLELCPDDQVNQCFWIQANALGQDYSYLCGRTLNPDRDFEIDPAQLAQVLDSLDRP